MFGMPMGQNYMGWPRPGMGFPSMQPFMSQPPGLMYEDPLRNMDLLQQYPQSQNPLMNLMRRSRPNNPFLRAPIDFDFSQGLGTNLGQSQGPTLDMLLSLLGGR